MMWRSTHICSIIFDLGTRWRWVVSLIPRSLYHWERDPGIYWIGGWVGPRDDVRSPLYAGRCIEKSCIIRNWTRAKIDVKKYYHRVPVHFSALPDFLSSGSGTGSTQPRDFNWKATSKKSSGSGLEIREYGCRDPSRWPRDTLYPQNMALTSPTSGGRSVSIVRSRFKATEF
jgi:hypothetical protein